MRERVKGGCVEEVLHLLVLVHVSTSITLDLGVVSLGC